MKTLLPRRPLQITTQKSAQVSSFSQKQTSDLRSKYQKTVEKRRLLARARVAADAQGDTQLAGTYKAMEQQSERSIDRLQDEMKVVGLDVTDIE